MERKIIISIGVFIMGSTIAQQQQQREGVFIALLTDPRCAYVSRDTLDVLLLLFFFCFTTTNRQKHITKCRNRDAGPFLFTSTNRFCSLRPITLLCLVNVSALTCDDWHVYLFLACQNTARGRHRNVTIVSGDRLYNSQWMLLISRNFCAV